MILPFRVEKGFPAYEDICEKLSECELDEAVTALVSSIDNKDNWKTLRIDRSLPVKVHGNYSVHLASLNQDRVRQGSSLSNMALDDQEVVLLYTDLDGRLNCVLPNHRRPGYISKPSGDLIPQSYVIQRGNDFTKRLVGFMELEKFKGVLAFKRDGSEFVITNLHKYPVNVYYKPSSEKKDDKLDLSEFVGPDYPVIRL